MCDALFNTNNRQQVYCGAKCRSLGTGKIQIKKSRKLSPRTLIKNPFKRSITYQGVIEIKNEGLSMDEIQKLILSRKKTKFYYERNKTPSN